ncbi:MAG TPA: metallophosphoesterase [Fimbriiglobus sp.]|jgi:predicted MPP superfamily phosphohydrolase
MNRLFLGIGVTALLATAVAFSRQQPAATTAEGGFQVTTGDKNPWTSLKPNVGEDQFQFVVVSDRTGGHRDKIFSRAIQQINLLQPEFVVTVGDLIEGYSTDMEKVKAQWDELDSYVKKLEMPFFYVPGNHDVNNRQQVAYWGGRYGKRYYHFTYKNVFFLCLDTEDGPGGNVLSKEQQDFAVKALADNANVRWTVVITHKPIWTARDQEKAGFAVVEKALAGRNYTVFCGHMHRYQKYVRNGMNYYQLATTGGGSKLRGIPYGEFDQIVWVTMKKDGPRIANVLLDGILPENLTIPDSDEKGVTTRKVPVFPVRGKLTLDGKPLANAIVTFTQTERKAGSRAVSADGITAEDGSFALTTYSKFDGAPDGPCKVTITANNRRPGGLIVDEKDVLKLPTKYGKASTTPLKATVEKTGTNELNFDLSSKD